VKLTTKTRNHRRQNLSLWDGASCLTFKSGMAQIGYCCPT